MNGIVTLELRVMIWEQMPFSVLWLIGADLGIDLVFNGRADFLLGLNIRELPA